MDAFFNFLTDTFKTTITSISSICFGLIIDIPVTATPVITFGTKLLQHTSLILGCIVALFAILNGCFVLYNNIQKCRGKYRKNKLNKKSK